LFLSPSGQARRPWPAGLDSFDEEGGEEEEILLASVVLSSQVFLELSEEVFVGSTEEDRRLGEELPLPLSM
jgi:hypothetical protein